MRPLPVVQDQPGSLPVASQPAASTRQGRRDSSSEGRKRRDGGICMERMIGRAWRIWREFYARTLRLAHTQVSLDHSVPCSSTNKMPLLGPHNSPLATICDRDKLEKMRETICNYVCSYSLEKIKRNFGNVPRNIPGKVFDRDMDQPLLPDQPRAAPYYLLPITSQIVATAPQL